MTYKDTPEKVPPKEKAIITIDTDPPSVTPLLTDQQHNWWFTYNAALTGMYINPQYVASGPAYIHLQAKAAADAAHGEYEADPPPP
jgi:hypothetical protein